MLLRNLYINLNLEQKKQPAIKAMIHSTVFKIKEVARNGVLRAITPLELNWTVFFRAVQLGGGHNIRRVFVH